MVQSHPDRHQSLQLAKNCPAGPAEPDAATLKRLRPTGAAAAWQILYLLSCSHSSSRHRTARLRRTWLAELEMVGRSMLRHSWHLSPWVQQVQYQHPYQSSVGMQALAGLFDYHHLVSPCGAGCLQQLWPRSAHECVSAHPSATIRRHCLNSPAYRLF